MDQGTDYRVYVLQNPEGKRYIGMSENASVRLEQHNNGISRWTRGKGPWELIWLGEAMDLGSARRLENLLKRQKGGAGFLRATGLSKSRDWAPRQRRREREDA